MKHLLIIVTGILALTFYRYPGVSEAGESIPVLKEERETNDRILPKRAGKPDNQAAQEKLIIRMPGKEEIPESIEEAQSADKFKPIEAIQKQPDNVENNPEEPEINPLPPVDEKVPLSHTTLPSPETPKDPPPMDAKERQCEHTDDTEDTVITPTRTKQLSKNVGSSLSIITQKDIENSKSPLLLDVLRQAPGIEVTRTQGIGGTTSLFIRGASAAHTLVFVDGVRINSPTSGAFNFSNPTTHKIYTY